MMQDFQITATLTRALLLCCRFGRLPDSLVFLCLCVFFRGKSVYGHSDRLPGHWRGDLSQPRGQSSSAHRQARLQVVQRYTCALYARELVGVSSSALLPPSDGLSLHLRYLRRMPDRSPRVSSRVWVSGLAAPCSGPWTRGCQAYCSLMESGPPTPGSSSMLTQVIEGPGCNGAKMRSVKLISQKRQGVIMRLLFAVKSPFTM